MRLIFIKNNLFRKLGDAIGKYDAMHVYVASDDDYMLVRFQTEFPSVNFFKYEHNSPHVDLNILGTLKNLFDFCVIGCTVRLYFLFL
jgi:hypothetical protein